MRQSEDMKCSCCHSGFNKNLDGADKFILIRDRILGKSALKQLYVEIYNKFRSITSTCASGGPIVELGSGGGFIQDLFPDVFTSDIISYKGLNLVFDAQKMPFKSGSLSCLLLNNVLHHIPKPELFFLEAARCLKNNGKIVISDQFPGWISRPIYKYLHHELYDENSKEWEFLSNGPLSSANGALPYIIFFRDRHLFEKKFKTIIINSIYFHTSIRYWLSGGLKKWTLVPYFLYHFITLIDNWLIKIHPKFASFFIIELIKNDQ